MVFTCIMFAVPVPVPMPVPVPVLCAGLQNRSASLLPLTCNERPSLLCCPGEMCEWLALDEVRAIRRNERAHDPSAALTRVQRAAKPAVLSG